MTVIGISEFVKNIVEVLQIPVKKDELVPTVLFTQIQEVNKAIGWLSIPNWDLFEYGHDEWGIDEFLMLLQCKEGDELQILTDRSYQHDEAVVYKDIDHSIFEENYGSKYGEEFFQPLDYVVIRNDHQVILLHHEGLLAFI